MENSCAPWGGNRSCFPLHPVRRPLQAAVPAAAGRGSPPPLDGTLEAVGAIGGSIYNRADMSPEALAKSPIMLHLTIKSLNPAASSATVSLTAEDMFGKPVAINGETQFSMPLQKGAGQKEIPFKAPGPGYFQITASVQAGADTATVVGDFWHCASPTPRCPAPIPSFAPSRMANPIWICFRPLA